MKKDGFDIVTYFAKLKKNCRHMDTVTLLLNGKFVIWCRDCDSVVGELNEEEE